MTTVGVRVGVLVRDGVGVVVASEGDVKDETVDVAPAST